MISYEAVESGARVLIEDGQFGVPWEDASEDDRTDTLARVRAILEAAAPYMQADLTAHLDHAERLCESNASGKEFAVVSVQDLRRILNHDPQRSRPTNPHRSRA